MQEGKKLLEFQNELDDAKLKMAQMEISQESWKKKYDKVSGERKDLLTKVGNKLEADNRELQARKLQIEKLEADLKRKEDEVDATRNLTSQMMAGWAAELKESKTKEAEKDGVIEQLRSNEEKLSSELNTLRDKEKQLKGDIDILKHKYQRVKQSAHKCKVKTTADKLTYEKNTPCVNLTFANFRIMRRRGRNFY